MNRSITALALSLLLSSLSLHTAKSAPQPYPERLRWWAEARFGLFIHWGPVSLTGQEIGWARGDQVPIAEYDQLYTRFNPTNFNAEAWVQTARAAGMKYVVLTTKHHDGFCLWDTKQTDHNIMRSPFGRDVVKELSTACRQAGLRFCTYYSTCDWHHPDFPLTSPGGRVKRPAYNLDRYEQYLRAQVKELITQYGPLGILWFDVPQYFDQARGQGVIDFVHSLQPDLIINDRSGAPGDYDTPEQRVGAYQDQRPWETCMTICRQWAWKPDDDMKSLRECIQNLVLCAAGDGNLLFNVGPMPDGRIEPRQVARLKEMGQWLERFGKSIYGTRGGPWKPVRGLASTRNGSMVFLHVLSRKSSRIELPGLPVKVRSATLMDRGGEVSFEQEAGKFIFDLAKVTADPIDTIVQIELESSAMDLPAQSVASVPIKATASNVFQGQAQYGPDAAFDADPASRWATDAGTTNAWIIADLLQPRRITGIRIDEALEQRVRRFEVQYLQDGLWKGLFKGQTIGPSFVREFAPVTAQQFRLDIQEAIEGPTFAEIEFVTE